MAERIEGLSVGLSLDTLEMERGLTGLKDRLKTVTAEMKNNMSVYDRADKSVEKYETRIGGLNKKLQVQEKVTDAARKSYENMVDEYGAGSKQAERAQREYEKQSAALNNLSRYVKNAEDDLVKMRQEVAKQETALYKFGEQAEKTGKKLTAVGEGMKDIGEKSSQYVTLPIAAGMGFLSKQAIEAEDSQTKLQNALGLTGDKAEETAQVARDVYMGAWGDSMEHVEGAIISVQEQLGEFDDPAMLENITIKALQLEDVFEMDMAESLRGVNSLMEVYGMTADEAFDYITVGAQNGLNKTDELGDNLAEYATLFEENGYTAEEMFNILDAGLDGGAYNLDKVNDLIKEFGIRIGDGTIKDAVAEMGGEWQKLYDGWEEGGGTNKELFEIMSQELAKIEDPQQRQLALTEIWGTMGEDAGYKVVTSMGQVEDKYNDVNGAMDTTIENTNEAFGARVQSLFREFTESLLPLGEAVLDLAEEYLPKLNETVSDLTGWIKTLDEDSVNTALKIAGLAAAIGPVIVVAGNLISIVGGVSSAIGAASGWITTLTGGLTGKAALLAGLKGVAAFMTGPWGLAIAALIGGGTLAYNYFKDDAIPVVNEFGDEVSETTAESIKAFEELHTETKVELDLLFADAGIVTEEGKNNIIEKFGAMYEMINEEQDEKFAENKETLRQHFLETDGIMDEEEGEILANMEENYNKRQTKLEEYNTRAENIVQTAYDEERELTEEEENELNMLRGLMQQEAINTLSASEKEQKIIKEKMSREKGAIDARTAADTVKRSKEARDGVVAEAEGQYEDTIAAIIYERDTTGTISEEKADELIAQAEKQRDKTVEHADAQHEDIVAAAKAQAGEHVEEVDWETGEVLSKWDVFVDDVDTLEEKLAQGFRDTMSEIGKAVKNGATDVYNGMVDTMNGAIKAATAGINGINKAINWVSGKLGLSFRIDMLTAYQIPKISTYSRGGGGSSGATRRYATGTDHHPGGPAIVGDGGEPELLLYPNGHVALSPDHDTLLDLPRGTTVISGPETKDMMNSWDVPKYAGGIGDVLSWGKSMLSKGVGALKNVGGTLWEWAMKGGKTLLSSVMSRMGITAPDGWNGALGNVVKGTFNKIKSLAYGSVDKLIPDMVPGSINFSGLRKTSGYGPRRSPGGIGSRYHRGVDYAAPQGTLIRSQSGGRVVDNGYNRIRGNYVRVKQGAFDYMYQHNLANLVGRGQGVTKGQAIARLGSTGASTGPHLHFEIWKNGVPINPEKYISGGFAGGGLVNDDGLYNLAEGGYPEFVIPTDPSKRTDAMKLLALASQRISKNNNNKTPKDLPAASSTSGAVEKLLAATMEQNEILRAILAKDNRLNVSRETITDAVEEQLAFNETGGYF